jgi:G3E family GTPase
MGTIPVKKPRWARAQIDTGGTPMSDAHGSPDAHASQRGPLWPDPATGPSIVLLTSVDPVLRGSASFAAVTDVPGTVVLTQDIDPFSDTPIHRHIADAAGVLVDEWVEVDHACATCALREDTIPTLQRLVAEGRYPNILVAAPVGVESLSIARALDDATSPGGPLASARLASVATVCEVQTLVHDLLGDDLLAERGLALADGDLRSVGEVLAHQVAYADFVLTAEALTSATPQAVALLDHIRSVDAHLVEDYLAGRLVAPFTHSHLCEHASRRVDPMHVGLNGAPERDGVWSLHLSSPRPMHPQRFMELLPELSGDKVRSRGHFWLPTRPFQACIWDGAGAQLSIGTHGDWGARPPATSLVFTGIAEERSALVEAFDAVLLTPEEEAGGPAQWFGRDDGLDEWLGQRM